MTKWYVSRILSPNIPPCLLQRIENSPRPSFAYVGETPDTKTAGRDAEVPQSKDYVNQGGLSRNAIFTAVDASLKRLNTDYIDLLQIHRFDKSTPIEETMKALHDVVQSGKVRYIGAR